MNLHDEIVKVAYELFEARGCIHGCDLEDWLDAERTVLSRHAGQEIEEPEEEDVSEETASARVALERIDTGENGESFNEEMS